MILSNSFQKTVFISLLGHLALFGIFSFSFGNRMPRLNYAEVSFLGSVLGSRDLVNSSFGSKPAKAIFNLPQRALPIKETAIDYPDVFRQYYKPPVTLPFSQDKIVPVKSLLPFSFNRKVNKPVVMLYPQLPYHFLIYFKDRQSAHMELLFNVAPRGRAPNNVMIKRSISSGNLEVDLLAMRYIGHYLFIQQGHFLPDNWQTVKIDLSAKND